MTVPPASGLQRGDGAERGGEEWGVAGWGGLKVVCGGAGWGYHGTNIGP